jgi:catechol 2,3-dioxygenase-like lactoylglutathione lyase family enzyme
LPRSAIAWKVDQSVRTLAIVVEREIRVPLFGGIDEAALTQSGGIVVQVRIARQTGRLDDLVAFYRDGLGLPELTRFVDHDGYSGVILDLPGTGAHLEFTSTEHVVPPTPHVEDLLVLYLGHRETVDRLVAQVGVSPVPSANPYWDRVGVTILDPDGFRVVLAAGTWPDEPADLRATWIRSG